MEDHPRVDGLGPLVGDGERDPGQEERGAEQEDRAADLEGVGHAENRRAQNHRPAHPEVLAKPPEEEEGSPKGQLLDYWRDQVDRHNSG